MSGFIRPLHNGISRRIEVWSKQNGIRPARLYVSNKSLDLFHPDGARRLEDVIERVANETGETPQLIVIDTLARNFSGDENSAGDISKFINHLDEIRFRWGASVLIVHHSGKNPGRGSRGSTALTGAVDAEYEFTRDRDAAIRVTNLKMKEADKPIVAVRVVVEPRWL
ncbi:MAG: AAA family ATPase [Pseudomonas sp.]